MFKRSLFLGALLLCLAPSLSYAEIMHEAAKTNPVHRQAYVDKGKTRPEVVGLYGYDGSNWWNIGSGTVISPHHVLGAAHSALNNGGNLYERYGMVTGNHLVNDWWGGYYTTQVTVHPQYTAIIVSPDMAIWTFDDVIEDVTPATLFTGNDSDLLGSLVDLVGFGSYGYPSTGTIETDGAKRGCVNELTRIGWPIEGAGSDQLITHFCPPGDTDYQYLGGMSASGDSGGGVFVHDEAVLFGVNAYHIGTYQYGYSGATGVSRHRGWIYSVVPEPSTLLMMLIGGALLALFARRRRG